MMKKILSVSVKNKNHPFSITPKTVDGEKLFLLDCPAAGVSQYFDNEDLISIINDLPELIIDEQAHLKKTANKRIQIRVSEEEKVLIEKKASKKGLSTSEYIRGLAMG